jgi:hypothetical protein
MRFFLPAKYTKEAPPPKPSDTRVRIVALPARTVAALRDSGSGRGAKRKEQTLLETLETSAWQASGRPYTQYYDPPFTIPFLRRNEAAVTVEKRSTAPLQ